MDIIRKVKRKLVPDAPEFQREKYAKQQHPEVKVLLSGLMQSSNLGDGVISDCVSFLMRKAAKENGIKKLKITTKDIRKQKSKADLASVRNSDMVMFPGGGMIKYKVENLPVAMDRVVSRAEHYGIPTFFNSVGVEGFDETDDNCKLLCNMLDSFCVKGITSRDYADFLNTHYLKGLTAKRVSDPAVWAGEVYDAIKDADSEFVGLGIGRPGLFTDYGIEFCEEEQLKLWKNIIDILESKGIKWKLFTNGLKKDEEFLEKILSVMGKSDNREDYSLKAPETPQELVENIAKFKGVIATRMHANIIAFALDIPCVGLVWNEKMSFFGESIGVPHRFITKDNFTAEHIVNTFLDALEKGYDKDVRDREKLSAFESVKGFFVPFAKDIVRSRRRDLTEVKTVCYGLPNMESEKLNHEFFKNSVDYFVSDDESLIGTNCFGKPILDSKKLKKRFSKKPFVIISETVDYTPCAKELISYGYIERYDFVNMHAYKRYVFKKGDVFIENITSNITV